MITKFNLIVFCLPQRLVPMRYLLTFLLLACFRPTISAQTIDNLDYYSALKTLKLSPAVIMTVASELKVHGPHLPLKTDSILAEQLSRDLTKATTAAVLPNFNLGWYPQFDNFSIVKYSASTIHLVTKEHLESVVLSGAKRLFIINFDVERSSGLPLGIVATELRQKYRIPILVVSWHDFVDAEVTKHTSSFKGHADEIETSLMLYLAPELVQKNKIKDVGDLKAHAFDVKGLYPIILDTPKAKTVFSVPGQFGMATQASAEKGEKIYQAILANLVSIYQNFLKAEP